MTILPLKFYQNPDVLQLSQDLLGKFLITQIGGVVTGGMIIETEAYQGPEDRASHAFGNRRTKRTEVMFKEGGISYVYLCYGIYYLFNIVTNVTDIPHAILIRGIKPTVGIEEMLKRSKKTEFKKGIISGPGLVCQALGIKTRHSGLLLNQPPIWVEDKGVVIKKSEIISGPRVGVQYAGEDALLNWRFRVIGDPGT